MSIPYQVWEEAARIKDADSGNISQIIERLEAIGRMTGLLHEATIGRVFQHLKSGEPFAIITAYRWPETAGNRASNQRLTHDLKSAGYSWVRARGVWNYTDEVTGEKVQVIEPSYVVYGIPRDRALFFAAKYGQQGVVWGSDEEGIWVLSTQHTADPDRFLGIRPSLDVIGDAWTQLRDRRFVFTGKQPQDVSPVEVNYQASSLSDAQGWMLHLAGVLYENCPDYMVKSVLPRSRPQEERP